MRVAINAAVIEEKKLLLVRKRNVWILPGGKPEKQETDLECLCREFAEELSGTKLNNLKHYRDFEGRTPNTGDILLAKVYFASIDGILQGVRQGDSIDKSEWVYDFSKYHLSEITSKIVDALTQDKYLC